MAHLHAAVWALLAILSAGCGTGPDERPVPAGQSAPRASSSPTPAGPAVSDGRPADALLSIPQIGLVDLEVIAYRGKTDDAPGTEIQNRGLAASPTGPEGGVGPGGVGNYQVTAHRLSSTQAFLRLPELQGGDRIRVVTDDRLFSYEIVETRETSFRSESSLRAQRAAVPGKPEEEPTHAYLTLSTCATPEDRAAGNFWSDQFGNPEHRIDKIGRLVASEPLNPSADATR